MYTIGNMTYADAGNYLVSNNSISYFFPAGGNIEERSIDLSKITIKGSFAYSDDFKFFNKKTFNYAAWKSHIIKWRYSTDDQIAIILNGQSDPEDSLKYEKMMEWRDWASRLAKIMVSLNGR